MWTVCVLEPDRQASGPQEPTAERLSNGGMLAEKVKRKTWDWNTTFVSGSDHIFAASVLIQNVTFKTVFFYVRAQRIRQYLYKYCCRNLQYYCCISTHSKETKLSEQMTFIPLMLINETRSWQTWAGNTHLSLYLCEDKAMVSNWNVSSQPYKYMNMKIIKTVNSQFSQFLSSKHFKRTQLVQFRFRFWVLGWEHLVCCWPGH